jgi:HD-like signal output (HDOD) protein
VALKALDTESGLSTIDHWLHEARAVSRLSHPHLVPVFEADEHAGRPYLVFEYVPGPTLGEHLKSRQGALPAREAVGLMVGVLDALALAHDQGIVHRDLKPSNVLIDGEGRARVMDFGIAARMAAPGAAPSEPGLVCGTPRYIAPEAARGAAPQPSMDVLAAGVMLAEMLGGRRLVQERDALRALQRVQNEDLLAPSHLANGEAVDDGLRRLVQQALARDPAQRTRSAAALRQGLLQWLQGGGAPATVGAADGEAAGHATLDFLLRRMKSRADFPALSDAVVRIQRIASSESDNLTTLADQILKDVALTHKLLRLVNSAHYSAAGGAVGTVSRAVALGGFAGIRNMALSLVLLEQMQDKRHADQLKEEFLRVLMAATLANELTPQSREAEESFLAAMFQNLGRLLVSFYFPQEAQQIRELVLPTTARSAAAQTEHGAARRVLGLAFADIGQGVARSWGLPDALQKAMRVPEGEPPAQGAHGAGPTRQRWLGRMATEVADALLADGNDAMPRIDVIGQRYARCLGVNADLVQQASRTAQERLSHLAQAMQIQLGATARARGLLAPTAALAVAAAAAGLTAQPDETADDAPTLVAPRMPDAAAAVERLSQGVQDITQHMVADGFRLNDVLRMIMETMMQAIGFRRVVFCLRDPKTNRLTGRFGLGEQAAEVAATFEVPLLAPAGVGRDLFAAVCAKGADTLIADATQPSIAAGLPAWFTRQVKAPSFLLLPMLLKGAPFALIYADQSSPGCIVLDDKQLALLRTLRNQGVMAFRQAA